MNQTRRRKSHQGMKRSKVVVPWREGLLLHQAVKLAQVGLRFRSVVFLKRRQGVADLRSVLSILTLCATLGTALVVEARGADEQDAIQAVQQVFSAPNPSDSPDPVGSRRTSRPAQ